MIEKEIICTVCPLGCHIQVKGEKESVNSIEGNGCKRGYEYACAEFLNPVRILTTTVKTNSLKNPLIAVRSRKPIPKDKIMQCMKEIKKISIFLPVKPYDVIIQNICETGIDIVATVAYKR